MLKTMPKETLMQWAVGSIAVAGVASVAYIVVFPKSEPALPDLPVPDVSALVDPSVLRAPADDAPPPTQIASAAPVVDLAPSFDLVRVTEIGNVLLAGKAPATSAVAALIDEEQVAQSVSSAMGEFVMMFDVAPHPAPRVLELEVRLPDGGRVRSVDTILLSPSSDVLAGQRETDGATLPTASMREVTVAPLFPGVSNDPAPRPVTAPEPAQSDQTQGPMAVLVRSDGTVTVLGEAGRLPSPSNVVVDSVTYNAEGEVAVGGRSTAGLSEIQIYLDNQPILRTRSGEDGAWQAQLDGIERGVYRLRIDELDQASAVTSRAEIPFERVTPEIARVSQGPQAVIVQPGNTLWAMSRDQFGDGARYTRIFDANRDQIRDPNRIFPGQVFVLPVE